MMSRIADVFGQLHPNGGSVEVTVGRRELVVHSGEMTWNSRLGPTDDVAEIEQHVLDLARGHSRAFVVNGRSLTRRTSARSVFVPQDRRA